MRKIFLILSLFIFSCDDEEKIIVEDYTFPINTGNMWIYEGSIINQLYDSSLSPHNSVIILKDTIMVDSLLSSVGDFSNNIYIFKTTGVQDGTPYNEHTYNYFSNEKHGLLHHGYQNAGATSAIHPGSAAPNLKIKFKIKDEIFSFSELINIINYGSADLDLIQWESGPLISIKYPVVLNDQWTYRNYDSPAGMYKKVIQKDNDEFTIETFYDIDGDLLLDNNIQLIQTYNATGMLTRTAILDSVMTMNENGDSLGYSRFTTTHNLTDYQLISE